MFYHVYRTPEMEELRNQRGPHSRWKRRRAKKANDAGVETLDGRLWHVQSNR